MRNEFTDRNASRHSRRRFLAAALGAVAAPQIIPASALGKGNQVAPSERIVVGCIGHGNRGPTLMRGFLGQRDARVVAVCDVNGRQREMAKGIVDKHYGDSGCTAYNDFRELCGRPDIDAVCVASPDHWHVLHSLEAVRNGKDIYTEKALGLSLAQDKALRAACHRYGTVFQWGTQQRSGENFRFGCELVRNGRIGELQTIVVGVPHDFDFANQPTEPVPDYLDYDLWLGPAPWAPYTYHRCRPWTKEHSYSIWYHISDYCLGGIGGYWGIHHLDIAQWGHGTDHTGPVEVEGTATFPENGLADCATRWEVKHTYADGVTPTTKRTNRGSCSKGPRVGCTCAAVTSTLSQNRCWSRKSARTKSTCPRARANSASSLIASRAGSKRSPTSTLQYAATRSRI